MGPFSASVIFFRTFNYDFLTAEFFSLKRFKAKKKEISKPENSIVLVFITQLQQQQQQKQCQPPE